MQSYSLFELNEYVRRVLALNFAEAIWIRCEIGQLNESGGHLFMDLVQKADDGDELIARAESVIWSRTLRKLSRKPGLSLDKILIEGNEVLFKAQVDFHERYGFKLVIEEIDADYTLGKILVKRAEVLQKLKKEGLLHKNASLALPKVIQNVAVISSANAAGLQDYLNQINNNPYQYKITNHLFAATVQGDKAAKNISAQLKNISLKKDFDAVIIIRGGGARLDLSAFDEYELGKAIAKSKVPVITGIGHDVDETVADQVAHTDLKTPTAVADYIIHHNAIYESRLEQLILSIKESSSFIVNNAQLELRSHQQKISFLSTKKWQSSVREIDTLEQKFKNSIRTIIHHQTTTLNQFETLLKGYDLESVLGRGYAIVTKDGKKVDSVEHLMPSEHLNIILKDGNINVTIDDINQI